MTQVTKEQVIAVLMRQDNVGMHAVGRALVHLLNRQTAEEQVYKDTIVHNARGFTPSDATICTNLAQFYQRNGYLTEKQLYVARKPGSKGRPRIVKYWRQLLEEVQAKQEKRARRQEMSNRSDQNYLAQLRQEYTSVVDSDSEEIIKPVVDKLRALEAELGVEPYIIGGSVYQGISLQ